MNFDHGTTTLGFKYQGGVILCADSRATSGQYIGSQTMKKIVELNDYMLGTLAGGAADCVYWDRVLAKECRLHKLRYRKRMTVDTAARIICNISTEYKGMGLVMGMMLAGFDDEGAKLIYVDSEGMRTHGHVFSVGSGSPYALGVLDTGYRYDLSDQEAYDLARRAIYHATSKDAYSGALFVSITSMPQAGRTSRTRIVRSSMMPTAVREMSQKGTPRANIELVRKSPLSVAGQRGNCQRKSRLSWQLCEKSDINGKL